MRLLTLLMLTLLLLLLPCGELLAQSCQSDTLAPSPDPLRVLLPGGVFAAYPLHHSDVAIRTTRHSLLGTRWRNHYDDHMQFASYGLQLAMASASATTERLKSRAMRICRLVSRHTLGCAISTSWDSSYGSTASLIVRAT